jgi:mono/diheme cytochrome c family protein
MKLRHILVFGIIAVFLAACNFTLAEDVTPPPNYVEPTPAPTQRPPYPASPPNIENGAAIYAEKCAACHGLSGMGDGEQGKQLTVPVAALGSPAVAQKALPSDWYNMVTLGKIERFMPPFASLNDQQRWDVVAYSLTLHTTPEQLEMGKKLCGDCAKSFGSQQMMAALSENDLFGLIKNNEGNLPAFEQKFTDEEAQAIAAYLRSLTFSAPPAAPTAAPVTESAVTAEAGTPAAAADVTPQAAPSAVVGKASGSIENQTGADLPADLKVTLRGYEHGGDMNAAPAEIVTLESQVNTDGTFVFENVDVLENRIFLAEIVLDGMTYQSEFSIVEVGVTDITLKPIVLHASTEDFSLLKIESLQIFFDLANADTAQVFAVYSITNTSDKTVVVKMGEAKEIPFVVFPSGASGLGYEATQDTAPFLSIEGGFAMPPSEAPYGLIAYSSLPNAKEIFISQSAVLPIDKVTLLLPEGVEVDGESLTDGGTQPMMDSMNFHVYTADKLEKGESIDFTLSGAPVESAAAAAEPNLMQNKNLLIGVGVLGLALILVGGWMFWRDRNVNEEDEQDVEDDDELADPESLMDAIIALDDLHRAGKLSEEAYQLRRAELKEALRRK